MKVGVYYNKNFISDNREYVQQIQHAFEKSGNSCIVVQKSGDLEGIDVLFVLGGDGLHI